MSTWRRFSITLQRFSTGRGVLIAGVIFVLFTALTLPGQTAEAERMAQGAGVPDTSLWYTPADLTAMAESYGPAGRQAYLQARWTFDLIFPLAYTAFLVTAIGWLARRISGPSDRWQMANLLPVLGMALDYLENIAASIVMARYPAPSPVAVHLAPIFTLLKWVCAGGSSVLLLGLALAALWHRLHSRTPV
ncbi:MAG: hypothetical protein KBH71_04045 [Anaerolineae bacterium]|nr:hypothetical protein [Anaerolineae bacterium]